MVVGIYSRIRSPSVCYYRGTRLIARRTDSSGVRYATSYCELSKLSATKFFNFNVALLHNHKERVQENLITVISYASITLSFDMSLIEVVSKKFGLF